MGKSITWICDQFGKEAKSYILPRGWLEASFYTNGRFYRYCCCGYSCLIAWAEKREQHYQDRFDKFDNSEVSCEAKV